MTSQTYATRRGDRMQQDRSELERLLTPAEVAAMFRVDPKTVTRWARAASSRTSGHWAATAGTAKPKFTRSSP